MRKTWAAAVLVLALLAVFDSPVQAAEGGASADAKLCKSEYGTLRGSGGEQFATAGRCISFVSRGGSFQVVDVTLSYYPTFDGGSTNVVIDASGFVGETVHLHEIIGLFVLSTDVFTSEFPITQVWACSVTGSVTLIDNVTAARATEVFAPPPEACAGEVGSS